ncbi:MAG: RNA polymerase sigma factor [Lewinellaceae bacterium]|nr:RNA polymerase sigma factor [Lewinellaceae bacterium]
MNWTIFHQHVYPIRHKLYRFALRMTGSVPEAEDVVQEVLERVWKSSEVQSEGVQSWEAWCMILTRNRSLDKLRSNARRSAKPLDGVAEQTPDGADTARAAEARDMAEQARRFMQELPEKQRLVMHLRDIEEMSYEEITRILDIPMDQVKVSLHRARKAIREKLVAADVHFVANT